MGRGYCVIGLEQTSPGVFRSVRPMPPAAYAWRDPFPGRRGDSVVADLSPAPQVAPHTEDRQSQGLKKAGRRLDESQLVSALRHSEVAARSEDLFGCSIHSSGSRGNCWVTPGEGFRSICGCELGNIRFRIVQYAERTVLRAQLVIAAGDRFESLPVVDREWAAALQRVMAHYRGPQAAFAAERFFNAFIRRELMRSPNRFARIGLARGMSDGKCWLMLDSLFPQPDPAWFQMAG